MPLLGEISALTAALLWSATSFIFTSAIIKLGALALNVVRLLLATFFLAITIIVFNIDYSLSFNQIFFLMLSGVIGLVIGDSFLFKSFSMVGPRISLLVYSLNPAIAALLAYIILFEVLSIWSILGMLITLTGIFIVILEKNVHSESRFKITQSGLFFALFGALGQAVGLIFSKVAYQECEINGLAATFVRLLGAVIVILPLTAVIKKINNPIKALLIDKKLFAMTIIGSLLGPYIGITLSFFAIIYTKIGIASTLMSTMPILMLPLTKIIYKEKLSLKSILGAFITVSGVAILFLK
jgi:drug/metabolite transporter (DMT)-like permease